MSGTPIRHFFARRFCIDRRLADTTKTTYEASLSTLGEFATTHQDLQTDDPDVELLTDEILSEWIIWCEDQTTPKGEKRWASRTIHGKRADVLAILRYAAIKLLRPEPGVVRPVNVPRHIPRAWSRDDFEKVLAACNTLAGYLPNGLPARLYFRACYEVAFYTGLRRGDLWRLNILTDVSADGTIATVQGKTMEGHVTAIPPETRKNLLIMYYRLKRDGEVHAELPLRWPANPRAIYDWTHKICKASGVDESGAFQRIRRTGATDLHKHHPGKAKYYLGHRTDGLAERNYIDPRFCPIVTPDPLADHRRRPA